MTLTCTGMGSGVAEVSRRADVTLSGTPSRTKTHVTVTLTHYKYQQNPRYPSML